MGDQRGARRGLADWSRSRPTAVAAIAALLVGGLAWLLSGDDDFTVQAGPASSDAGAPATTVIPPLATSTSSSAPPTTVSPTQTLPAGDDATVARVIDGDSFAAEGGTGIRLIGVNAPEVETDECYSEEATAALRRLLPAGSRVRLVYDQERLDRFGRTLAYVYRLTDGLFVNVVLASDGFAREMATAPNLAHATDFRDATTEARLGNRGLWTACGTSTTSGTASTSTTTTTRPATSTTRL